MKRSHEGRAREWQDSSDQLQQLNAEGFRASSTGNSTFNAWRIDASVVVVDGYGTPPSAVSSDRWRGAGLEFRRLHLSRGGELLFSSSEAEPDVEYWVTDTKLHVVQSTYEPTHGVLVPFAEHAFDVRKFPASRYTTVLLELPPEPTETLSEIVAKLKTLNKADASRAEILLYHLRNAGLRYPDLTAGHIEELRTQWWYDGCAAEAAAIILEELKIVAFAGEAQ